MHLIITHKLLSAIAPANMLIEPPYHFSIVSPKLDFATYKGHTPHKARNADRAFAFRHLYPHIHGVCRERNFIERSPTAHLNHNAAILSTRAAPTIRQQTRQASHIQFV